LKEFFDQLSPILLYGGILQGIFVVVLLLNKGNARKSRANLFLSILLIALTFSVFHLQYAGRVLHHFSVRVQSLGDPTFFLIAPLLWFYTCELTGSRVRISLQMVLHFLPFLGVIFFSLFSRFLPADSVSIFRHSSRLTAIFFWGMVVIQFSGYQFVIRRRWLVYERLVAQEVSNTEDVSIAWVRFFMGVFLLVNLFFLFSLFAAIHLENGWRPEELTALVLSLSIFALGYKGILQKEIFETSLPEVPLAITTPEGAEDIARKSDPELLHRLQTYMAEKKPFLDPELTLTGLAYDLGISRSQLSQLINEGTGDNFYDFVNRYRVEQIKQLMGDPKVRHYSLLGLALEAGFKSKSTFNLIFKRFTGLTPTEYRKNLSE
jgi:AraC-like DNA-binding protein